MSKHYRHEPRANFPCEADLKLYTAKRLPQWAKDMRAAEQKARASTPLIDVVVNAHAWIRVTSGECAAHNLMMLVSSCQRRTPDALTEYLESIARNPQCAISPKRRAGFARKWARKLSQAGA